MSKAKNNADELDLSADVPETVAEETVESAISEKVAEPVAEKVTEEATYQKVASIGKISTMAATNKMGLSKFLRLHPQNIYVTALLQKYKSKVMTEQEWLDLVDQLMNQKING